MDLIVQINDTINGFVWGPIMLVLLVGTGVYYSLRLGLFQVTKIPLWWKSTIATVFKKREKAAEGAITPFQALTTALAATVGTGNIVGVATAIVSGGPGAVFWMWISAFFGMMTKYAEIVLSVNFRKRNKNGEWVGGPMYYIREGMGPKFSWLSYLFALLGALACFGIGNMTQTNSISTSMEQLMVELGVLGSAAGDGQFSVFKFSIGIILAVMVGLVIIGGLKRIGSVTEKLVPFMALVYVTGAIIVVVSNAGNLVPALTSIIAGAFNPQAAFGGAVGYTIATAMRFGVARGVFSNEAGLGSAPIAHAAADAKSPVHQGLWGIFEVFCDTLVICTLNALVILTSGVYNGTPDSISGSPLTMAAYSSVLGIVGTAFVTICIALFAFSTLLSWSLYGQRCFEYLTGGKAIRVYQIVFIGCILIASFMELDLVWGIADTLNGMMAIPNLIGLVAMSGLVIKLTKEFLANRKNNKEEIQA